MASDTLSLNLNKFNKLRYSEPQAMRLDFDLVVVKFPLGSNSGVWTLDGFWALY